MLPHWCHTATLILEKLKRLNLLHFCAWWLFHNILTDACLMWDFTDRSVSVRRTFPTQNQIVNQINIFSITPYTRYNPLYNRLYNGLHRVYAAYCGTSWSAAIPVWVSWMCRCFWTLATICLEIHSLARVVSLRLIYICLSKSHLRRWNTMFNS